MARPKTITNYQGWGELVDEKADDPTDIDPPVGPMGPRVTPRYGCKSFTPQTQCSDVHHGPIKPNAMDYCEVCHKAGCDHWPRLGIPKSVFTGRGSKRKYVKRKLRGGIGE